MKSAVLLLFLSTTSIAAFADGMVNSVTASGFGRVVAGYLDDDAVTFEGYKSSWNVSEQSLLALQLDYQATDTISFTTQLLAHSSSERDSGIEWLYVTYQPNQYWQFKAGKMRTPFFNYSDVIDVGFAYTWVSVPQQLYSAFLFNHYEGASATYQFSVGDVFGNIEAYYGQYDDATRFQDQSFPTSISDMMGSVLNLRQDNLSFRASFFTGLADVELALVTDFVAQLQALGFNESANSLTMHGDVDVYQVGLNYDNLAYRLGAELVSIQSDIVLGSNITSYYLFGSKNFDPFSVSLTYANLNREKPKIADDIPLGVSSELDMLNYAYQSFFANFQTADLESYSLGIRWDVRYNIALKTEVTHFKGEAGIATFVPKSASASFDNRANLYQVSVEFIF